MNKKELINMITESIIKSILMEGTNMQYLYHFTKLENLFEIENSNILKYNSSQLNSRNNKNYISLTRHKSNLEGFSVPNLSNVRITLNMDKLNSIHNISSIQPYEYYSPNNRNKNNVRFNNVIKNTDSAKSVYQYAKAHNTESYGDEEYFNQAEESIESNLKYIKNIINYIERIDILIEETNGNNLYYLNKYYYANNTKFLEKTFIYFDKNNFALQTNKCVSIYEYYNKSYKQINENKK